LLIGVIQGKERPEVWQVCYGTPCGVVVTQLWRQCTACYAVKLGAENSVVATCNVIRHGFFFIRHTHKEWTDCSFDDAFYLLIVM